MSLFLRFSVPYMLTEVREGTITHIGELYEGDHIVAVNGRDALTMSHLELKYLVASSA
jgi:hypothetical protein